MATGVAVVLEPEFVDERTGAAVMGISPRAFAQKAAVGEFTRVRVPGLRRTVYTLSELRSVAKAWREKSAVER